VVAGVVAVGLAAGAHDVSGGRLPSMAGLVALVAAVAAASAPLLGSERPARVLVGLVVVQQFVVHAWLTYLGLASAPMAAVSGATAHPAAVVLHGHTGMQASHLVRGRSVPWAMVRDHLLGEVATVGGAAMLVAHLCAAIGVGWWLAAGERLFWSVLTMLGAGVAAAALRSRARRVLAPGSLAAASALRTTGQLRQRGGRWSLRCWIPPSRLELRGPPGRALLAVA
jgi:hypothetical protein